jgi:hypothetical protein
MKTRRQLYTAGSALVLVSCSTGSGSDVGLGTGACGQFTSQLHIEDKFRQESPTFISGEPIAFRLRIRNRGTPAALGYDGCPPIRFVVVDSSNQTVFDTLPDGTACTLQLRPIPYAALETKEFELEWGQTRTSDNGQVPSGAYTVNARDRSLECRGDLDRVRSFTIQ